MANEKPYRMHGLHGKCHYNVLVVNETVCGDCVHYKVCSMEMEKFCINYEFGTSASTRCHRCLHHYTRYATHKPLPCFRCNFFSRRKPSLVPRSLWIQKLVDERKEAFRRGLDASAKMIAEGRTEPYWHR